MRGKMMTSFRAPKSVLSAVVLFSMSMPAWAADITVSAAASLTDAFKNIAKVYEQQHPKDKVLLNFGASGSLLQQIDKGAPVDVFASADQETMNLAQQKNIVHAKDRVNFVGNSLVLITPVNSKLSLKRLADLKQGGVRHIAIGNPATVPAGRYTKAALEQARVWSAVQPKLVNTQNVRQALDYVSRQEAEAGFVFGTDAAIMKSRVKVAMTVRTKEPITYPIAKIANSKNGAAANQFIRFVRSPAGQKILHQYGFKSVSAK